MSDLKKYYPISMSILTSVLKHTCIFITFLLVRSLFFFFGPLFSPEEKILWQALVMFVVYLSNAYSFAVYNKVEFIKFSEKEEHSALMDYISFNFIFDFLLSVLFFFVLFPDKTTSLASIASIISGIIIYGYARVVWSGLISRKKDSHLFLAKLIVHTVLAIPALFVLFFIISYFIPTVSTVIMVLKLISYMLIIPAVLAVWLYIRAIRKMSKFLKKLKKYCEAKKIKMPKIKSPYLSVFASRPKNTFDIEINGKIFTCNILSFTNIFRPVIFRSDGYYYRISARALKRKDGPSLLIESAFTFDSPNAKVVLITSTPYVVMIREGNSSKNFDVGDMCGEYKIFTPDGFFSAAERNTISRKSFE